MGESVSPHCNGQKILVGLTNASKSGMSREGPSVRNPGPLSFPPRRCLDHAPTERLRHFPGKHLSIFIPVLGPINLRIPKNEERLKCASFPFCEVPLRVVDNGTSRSVGACDVRAKQITRSSGGSLAILLFPVSAPFHQEWNRLSSMLRSGFTRALSCTFG